MQFLHYRFTLFCVFVHFFTCIHYGLGQLHHKGSKVNFSSRFGQGSIIGVHLDNWHGTLSFYKNRRCIGKTRRKDGIWVKARNFVSLIITIIRPLTITISSFCQVLQPHICRTSVFIRWCVQLQPRAA